MDDTLDPPAAEGDYDAQVGRMIQSTRKARGVTQAQLAALVEERGLQMRQQTVVKIEQGRRPLRLQEAQALADALGIDLDSLRPEGIDPDERYVTQAIKWSREVLQLHSNIERQLDAFMHAKARLAELAEDPFRPSLPREVAFDVADALVVDIQATIEKPNPR